MNTQVLRLKLPASYFLMMSLRLCRCRWSTLCPPWSPVSCVMLFPSTRCCLLVSSEARATRLCVFCARDSPGRPFFLLLAGALGRTARSLSALCSLPTAHPPQPPLAPGERSLSPRRRAGARVLWPIPCRSESLPPRLQRRPRGNAQRCAEEHQAPRMPLRDFGRARRARHGWSAAPDPPALQGQSSGEWWHWSCQDTGHPK